MEINGVERSHAAAQATVLADIPRHEQGAEMDSGFAHNHSKSLMNEQDR